MLKDNVTLWISAGAKLRAIPNSVSTATAVVDIDGRTNVAVLGRGIIQGEPTHRIGSTGESGMGVSVAASTDVIVEGPTFKDCWGDGVYQGEGASRNTGVRVLACMIDNNRRNGISVTDGSGVLIKGNWIKGTNGTDPQAGIDVEPDSMGEVEDVQITDNLIEDNTKAGLQMIHAVGCLVKGNVIRSNGENGIIAKQSKHCSVTGNFVEDNTGRGIYFLSNNTTNGNVHDAVSGNIVRGNSSNGIDVVSATNTTEPNDDNSIVGNLVFGNLKGITSRTGTASRSPATWSRGIPRLASTTTATPRTDSVQSPATS